MSAENVLAMIKEHDVKFIDLRFTDTKGKEQHVSIPVNQINEDFFEDGKMFDGSSIGGWKTINESDMVLMPDPSTAVMDPFTEDATLNIRCDVLEPSTMQGYDRDPRSIARRAEEYLVSTGIADTVLVRSRARILHVRRRPLPYRHVRQLLQDRRRRSQVELRP
jgi:glutamine synthetase